MIKNKTELLPGWTLRYNEVSNNVWEVLLIDSKGREAGTKDTDLERAVSVCEQYAFDIEKQISGDFNKFLFDTCKMRLAEKPIAKALYHFEAFGSWVIQINEGRLVFDGKDYLLTHQIEIDGEWENKQELKLAELDMKQLKDFIGYL
jgi:hypothetical protein